MSNFFTTIKDDVEGFFKKVFSPGTKAVFTTILEEAEKIQPDVMTALQVLTGILGANPVLADAEALFSKFMTHISAAPGVLDSAAQLETAAESAAITEAQKLLPAASKAALTTAIGLASGVITAQITASDPLPAAPSVPAPTA